MPRIKSLRKSLRKLSSKLSRELQSKLSQRRKLQSKLSQRRKLSPRRPKLSPRSPKYLHPIFGEHEPDEKINTLLNRFNKGSWVNDKSTGITKSWVMSNGKPFTQGEKQQLVESKKVNHNDPKLHVWNLTKPKPKNIEFYKVLKNNKEQKYKSIKALHNITNNNNNGLFGKQLQYKPK